LNLSIDKQQQQQQQRLNNSFNVYQQRRTYSLPNNNNNNLRTSSNKSKKQNSHQIKEEPILSDITINNTNNSVIQQDNKLNSPSIINDHNKVNSTFVCTFVRNGNTIQKYTLNTKANQNVPRASHYANYLLSKYKGVIAAYNEGQGKN
jgi:carboxylesterase type B